MHNGEAISVPHIGAMKDSEKELCSITYPYKIRFLEITAKTCIYIYIDL